MSLNTAEIDFLIIINVSFIDFLNYMKKNRIKWNK